MVEEKVTLLDYSSKVWIEHCQNFPKVYRNMFRVKPRATLGLIFCFNPKV